MSLLILSRLARSSVGVAVKGVIIFRVFTGPDKS
jgi:hypothetical protein